MWYIWLIFAGIFMVAEIITTGFLIFWLGLGALCSMLVSFFTDNLIIQTSVFLISSTIFILCTRKFANKISKNSPSISTNAYSIIGKKGIVSKEINPSLGIGQVKIGTDTWSAKSLEEVVIPENTEVLIVKIDGVKAVVTTDLSTKI